ncbi:hypothetical protein FACS1894156_6570 [Bacteroidia bacterium]|nr:hypothetical protein FACS1894156_6570 [Bacteroidia bacterium]
MENWGLLEASIGYNTKKIKKNFNLSAIVLEKCLSLQICKKTNKDDNNYK